MKKYIKYFVIGLLAVDFSINCYSNDNQDKNDKNSHSTNHGNEHHNNGDRDHKENSNDGNNNDHHSKKNNNNRNHKNDSHGNDNHSGHSSSKSSSKAKQDTKKTPQNNTARNKVMQAFIDSVKQLTDHTNKKTASGAKPKSGDQNQALKKAQKDIKSVQDYFKKHHPSFDKSDKKIADEMKKAATKFNNLNEGQ